MDIHESLTRFVEYGISLRRISDAAKVNKNTMTALVRGDKVHPQTIEKVKGALKDIALELYNIAYSDEVSKNEEWEE